MSDPIPVARTGRDRNGGAQGKGAQWANRAAGRLDQARKPVADKLYGAADSMRKQAQTLFERETISERVSDTVHGAADRAESSAAYLDSHDVAQMARDAVTVVKRHPVQFLLVAAAVGFVFSRTLRRN
jgi:ElaB/YqjD/DUF883 family membrane-anchored ribosome-binding protein